MASYLCLPLNPRENQMPAVSNEVYMTSMLEFFLAVCRPGSYRDIMRLPEISGVVVTTLRSNRNGLMVKMAPALLLG